MFTSQLPLDKSKSHSTLLTSRLNDDHFCEATMVGSDLRELNFCKHAVKPMPHIFGTLDCNCYVQQHIPMWLRRSYSPRCLKITRNRQRPIRINAHLQVILAIARDENGRLAGLQKIQRHRLNLAAASRLFGFVGQVIKRVAIRVIEKSICSMRCHDIPLLFPASQFAQGIAQRGCDPRPSLAGLFNAFVMPSRMQRRDRLVQAGGPPVDSCRSRELRLHGWCEARHLARHVS